MIDTLVIIVYDRFDNLKRWFHILNQCERPEKVVVIHNYDEPDDDYRQLCEDNNAQYIHRQNKGFDIGALQDVCGDRLKGFPEWEQLLWATDDTFPMSKDFLSKYALKPGEGVRATDISPHVRQHIRTTGFSMTKQVSKQLMFPADPIDTKWHCYLFEHKDHRNTFLDQVKRMGLDVVQVASRDKSPMWDSGYHRRLKREAELLKKWYGKEPGQVKQGVTVICPIYKSFPAVVSSFIMQTDPNWQLRIIHDGPGEQSISEYIYSLGDSRITYEETPERKGFWGHYIRSEYLQQVDTEFVMITNPDNYHVPVFIEKMLTGFKRDDIVATFCTDMVHSYKDWKVIPCRTQRGYLDCAGVVLRTSAAQSVGWNNVTEHSADWFFFADIIRRFGQKSFAPVPGCLLVHN